MRSRVTVVPETKQKRPAKPKTGEEKEAEHCERAAKKWLQLNPRARWQALRDLLLQERAAASAAAREAAKRAARVVFEPEG